MGVVGGVGLAQRGYDEGRGHSRWQRAMALLGMELSEARTDVRVLMHLAGDALQRRCAHMQSLLPHAGKKVADSARLTMQRLRTDAAHLHHLVADDRAELELRGR
jgi:hypothetical protein